jgi:hypothetical protein
MSCTVIALVLAVVVVVLLVTGAHLLTGVDPHDRGGL